MWTLHFIFCVCLDFLFNLPECILLFLPSLSQNIFPIMLSPRVRCCYRALSYVLLYVCPKQAFLRVRTFVVYSSGFLRRKEMVSPCAILAIINYFTLYKHLEAAWGFTVVLNKRHSCADGATIVLFLHCGSCTGVLDLTGPLVKTFTVLIITHTGVRI